ncbi:MAG TPA: hypothetical protein P5555_07350 [Candidatus Paceibacterota bacterium]|nr:hypothetical protein [Verrucomicrobiota bacterium]HRZ44992.1 hypothetical protein [Candidatus Paceibacterota bacterium]HRZ99350.1 hypothetical protein [Candidatus Paceibacterota bacterium]
MYDPLNALRLPGRLDGKCIAALLGFAEHDLPVLTRAGLIRPLADPEPNAPKWYCRDEILAKAADPAWLARATRAVSQNWRRRNARRSTNALAQYSTPNRTGKSCKIA